MHDHIQVRVHLLCLCASSGRLRFLDIRLSEEELTVQVRDLNGIVVSDRDRAIWSATETHESHSLDILAAKSTSSDHESLDVSKLLLDFATIDLDLVIVAAVHGLAVHLALGQGLEAVVVDPLAQRHVLASELDDLLGYESAKESGH